MLAVTTFSLSTMVAAYGSATSNANPRATPLITEDKTTQNALAIFLSTFIYSLVGIIALNMGIYDGRRTIILFFVTLAVITLIVVTFIRWIERLTMLGRVGETSRLVEEAASKAISVRARRPSLGCNVLEKLPDDRLPETSLKAATAEYVRFVEVEDLARLAEKHNFDVLLAVMPGAYLTSGRTLRRVSEEFSEQVGASLRKCFTIGDQRTFEQDQRFGLCVLSEIVSRAASEAVRDSGTALNIVGRLDKVLETYARERKEDEIVA